MTPSLDNHALAYQGDSLYDFDNEILMHWYPRRVLEFAQNAQSLLELGLGHGFTTNIFSSHFKRHLVLEGSEIVIHDFQKKYPDCSAAITQTWFEDFQTEELFDVIVMGFILEHVNSPTEILRKFRNFLAPGGRIFLAVPNAEVLNRRLGHAAGMLGDMSELSEHDHLLGHQRYYTVASLTEEIEKSGYIIEQLEGIYLKPFTTKQIISLGLNRDLIDALCKVGVDYPELSCGLLAEISSQ